MTTFDDFRFYFGAASGSARKTVRQLQEPDLMISYATDKNSAIDCENLFIDSGGYSLMLDTGTHDPPPKYLSYIEDQSPDIFALQDFPCEPDIMEEYDRSVEGHQERTIEYHAEGLARMEEYDIDASPLAVLQGWETDDYLRCIDRFEDEGLILDHMGIGSVCRRHAASDIRDIILAVRKRLPDCHLHAFGVKTNVLKFPDVLQPLDSADSLAYDWSYTKTVPGPRWHQVTKNYLEFKEQISDTIDTTPDDLRDEQQGGLDQF
jgi:hypothetical protein